MRRQQTAFVLVLTLLAIGPDGRAQSAFTTPDGPRVSGTARGANVVRLVNRDDVRKRLGLVPEYDGFAGISAVKVAVLDYGFEGAVASRAYLPESTVVVEHYDPEFVRRFGLGDPDYRKPFEPGNLHGRVMAQMIWAITGGLPGGPQFYLLNASGPTMLRRAVRYAIEQRVDVILFSGSFEGGGNGDGRGPINRVVDEALGSDILWINAAGNYGQKVYHGPVRVLSDGYLRLRDGPDIAALRFRNRLDENTITITLTWNDYREDEDAGTEKDLDLFVEDWAGRRIGAGEKTQISGVRPAGADESRNPRERIVLANLPASPLVASDPDYTYRIRVRVKRGRFTAADQIRILLTASREAYVAPGSDAPRPAVEFLDASGDGELYPPADHPLVLTVGDPAPDSSVGPTADRRVKPDVLLPDSRAYFSDGLVSAGSSNAAAYVAGVVTLLKAAEPRLRTRHLLLLARQGPTISRPRTATATTTTTGVAIAPSTTARTEGLHLWRTPTRAQLAAALRDGR